MAAKRRAGSQLTQDNWEEEEEAVEDTSFRVADNAVLSKRKMKKATRRIGAGAVPNKPSPFGAFKGFSSSSSSTSSTDKPTFGSSFQVSSSKPGFGSAFQVSSSKPQMLTAPVLNFGAKSSDLPSSTAPSLENETNEPYKRPALNGGANTTNSNTSSEYSSKLKALNLGVSAWIQGHLAKTPVCDLTPVFKDYSKHLADIERKYGSGSANSAGGSSTGFSSGGVKFGSQGMQSSMQDDSESVKKTNLGTSQGLFSFGSQSVSQSSASKDSEATQKTSLAKFGGFNFGGQAVSQSKTEEKKDNGLFGKGSGNITFGSTRVTFGSSAPTVTGSAGLIFPGVSGGQKKTEEKAQTVAADDEPPKPEVKVVEEKDALFSIRSKLYYKKDGQFKERGVGLLYLKKPESTGQLLLRADTSLGNIIFNISIPKALPVQRQGKNNVMLMAAMNPPPDKACPQCKKKFVDPQTSNVCESDCTPEATAILLRVKTGEDADKLLEEINKLKE